MSANTLGRELQSAGLNTTRSAEVAEIFSAADLSWNDLVNSYRRGQSVEVRADLDGLQLTHGTISKILSRYPALLVRGRQAAQAGHRNLCRDQPTKWNRTRQFSSESYLALVMLFRDPCTT